MARRWLKFSWTFLFASEFSVWALAVAVFVPVRMGRGFTAQGAMLLESMAHTEPIAYMNGQLVPQRKLLVPPQDLGFMWGTAVAEQLRTFAGKLFRLREHLDRLRESLNVVGVSCDLSEIEKAAAAVCSHNYELISPTSDLGLTIFVTPGLSSTYSPKQPRSPFVGMHSYELPFSLWADKYRQGQECEIVSIRQVPTECWPRHLKSRSRMHYYLADQEAKKKSEKARAILLDEFGNVNEASTANVVGYFDDEGFVSPPHANILPGVSLSFLNRLAERIQVPFNYRTLSQTELMAADEVLLTSTPFCVLPVSKIGQHPIPSRKMHDALIQAWSEHVGLNIVDQANKSQ